MGALMRCHLTYHGPQPAAPETVILKLPSEQPKNLRMSKRLGLHKREYDFYSLAAPSHPGADAYTALRRF